MIPMPKKETKIPAIFSNEILSFNAKNATRGVNSGMVAIITALIVGDEFFNPKFSPKKYRKGLNREDNRNRPRSSFLIFSNFPVKKINADSNKVEMMSLRKIVVIGL